MGGVIQVQAGVLERIEAEAGRNPNEECCGLLGGRRGIITEVFPAQNILASATAYEISPAELFTLFRAMRNAQLQHLGIYHSHVATDTSPSPRDIEQAYYSEVAYFIISPRASGPKPIRAFSIQKGTVKELTIASVQQT
jgi:proteasome lid subunit RPN8/RPN11